MKSSLLATLGGASSALAAVNGFNYASNGQNQASFEAQFRTASSLTGANNFTGARLYTMIQDGSTNTPISALPAAISTRTTLLLGLWASTDQNGFNNELAALKAAIQQYGPDVKPLVTGISVGSEDLYRISPTGIANGENPGQQPSVLVNYIQQVRDTIKGTIFDGIPVGHVDTWNVYVNGSNAPVIAAADFLGLDEYPYFQTTDSNAIDNAKTLFFNAYDAVAGVAGGKPIWITETGWPTSGKTAGQAVPSVENAERYWQDVSCELQRRNINTWWYILDDGTATPDFGVSTSGKPKYDLVCKAPTSTTAGSSTGPTSSAGSGTSSGTGTGTGSKPTTTGTGAGTGNSPSTTRGSGSNSGSPTTGGVTTPSFNAGEQKTPNSFTGLVVAAAAFVAFAL